MRSTKSSYRRQPDRAQLEAQRAAREKQAAVRADEDAARVAAGVCRHCGGAVPCRSVFGDQDIGVAHTRETFARVRENNGNGE
jgi:hypothetical protein